MKKVRFIVYIFGVSPILFIISILTFYIHAGIILGKLPIYNQPDPKELNIYSTYDSIIEYAFEIWFYTFPVWVLAVIAYLIISRKKINWKPIKLTGIIQTIGIIIIFSGIFEWYVD